MKRRVSIFFVISLIAAFLIAGQELWAPGAVLAGEIEQPDQPGAVVGAAKPAAVLAPGASQLFLPMVIKPAEQSWPMAGGNPERTSWTPEEVAGKLKPLWYRPIEAYIPQRVQVIGALDTIFLSSANGLYAFDPDTGAQKWVYPTELPLGHSPTIYNGIAYVGGFDRRIHAVNAYTGQKIWTFEAAGGFQTNPLVVNGIVYMGSRDGNLYAVRADTGQLTWKFQTAGPILFSAAYKDGVVYFASNDSHAYAVDANTGSLIWKSAKLPGAGFHSWWPVVYQDRVLLSTSRNYRKIEPGDPPLKEKDLLFPNRLLDPMGVLVGPLGSEPGNWVAGTPTIDTSKSEVTSNGKTWPITEFLEQYPWRRSLIVLNRFSGTEVTYDFDNDGLPEYAPIVSIADKGNQYYPPVVGGDGVLYMQNTYMSSPSIPGGHIAGWKIDTPYISIISSDWGAEDEPHAATAGGNLLYWALCCDRQAGAIDLTVPNTVFADRYQSGQLPPTSGAGTSGETQYFNYNLDQMLPDYAMMTYVWPGQYGSSYGGVYGGLNGVYGWHHDTDPPIPYQGKVFLIASNALIAFGPPSGNVVKLPTAPIVPFEDPQLPVRSKSEIGAELENEIQKMIAAGHLKPGYAPGSGFFESQGANNCGDDLTDYWHHPADTIYVLLRALPHLPAGLQQQLRTYIQSEFNAYPPYQYNHIGWQDGARRDIFDYPPDATPDFNAFPPREKIFGFDGWQFNPFAFYAIWKYAEEFGDAAALLQAAKSSGELMSSLNSVPGNAVLQELPFVHNAYIAGYIGYNELAKLANTGENLTAMQNTLNSLLASRAANMSISPPAKYLENGSPSHLYCRSLTAAKNFMYLVPELADYLRQNAFAQTSAVIAEAERVAPLWFVSHTESAMGEAGRQHLYDYNAIFQAKALILQESHAELAPYLDVPIFPVGDLFHVLNLISALEAPDGSASAPSAVPEKVAHRRTACTTRH